MMNKYIFLTLKSRQNGMPNGNIWKHITNNYFCGEEDDIWKVVMKGDDVRKICYNLQVCLIHLSLSCPNITMLIDLQVWYGF